MTAPLEPRPRRLRLWPAIVVLLASFVTIGVLRSDSAKTFQQRNLDTLTAAVITLGVLLLWWLFVSGIRWKTRFIGLLWILAVVGGGAAMFRIRGVSGDLVPILEPRWRGWRFGSGDVATGSPTPVAARAAGSEVGFPQYLGPNRDGVLPPPSRPWATNWTTHPPEVVWRHAIGAAWSGFVMADGLAWTQEQDDADELVTSYDLATGKRVWTHRDAARYATTIAGEGPRATPTVSGGRVVTLGATGILNCLDRATGEKRWSRALQTELSAGLPGWGFASSPLVTDGKVVVIAGGENQRSVAAFDLETGAVRWTGGTHGASYSSPLQVTLAGVPQVLAFNSSHLTAHDPNTGAVLWDHAFGNSQPHVAMPVVLGTNRVLISAGYGMGAELVEITRRADGSLTNGSVWLSKKLKAKFSNPFARDGFAYGLDDGILACIDLRDGSQRWKEGRYGHGQGLVSGDLFLLMAESGDLVLLRPTPEGAGELGRFRVFSAKTWNPIAVSGNLVLVRNDLEVALVRLPERP